MNCIILSMWIVWYQFIYEIFLTLNKGFQAILIMYIVFRTSLLFSIIYMTTGIGSMNCK